MSIGSISLRERLSSRYSQIADQLRFLVKDRLAFAGTVIIGLFFFLGLFGPVIAPHNPVAYSVRAPDGTIAVLNPPSMNAWLGTTSYGKDVFSQFLAGARPTLIVGLFGGLGTGLIGFLVGLTSGYFGGRVDEFLMRLTDLTFSLPLMPMALLLLTFIRPNIWIITLIIMLFLWKMPARVV